MISVADRQIKAQEGRRSVGIISFSPIYRDARVLRQIKYLSKHYDLSVIGYGGDPSGWSGTEHVRWYPIESSATRNQTGTTLKNGTSQPQPLLAMLKSQMRAKLGAGILGKLKFFMSCFILALGRFHATFYESWYWQRKHHRQAMQYATDSRCHAFLANDWEALPVAAEAARRSHGKVIFDAHEYAPLELENRPFWKLLFRPVITYFIEKYVPDVHASLTVAPAIRERYRREFGLDATVVLNAPEAEPVTAPSSNWDQIRLVHHGGAIRDRRLEILIETLALCERRFHLHLILVQNDPKYLAHLKRLANTLAPGRVTFHEPVPPSAIVGEVSQYDIGFCVIAPTNYNYLVSLPNKFFDYIMAGLAVFIGPSPSMEELVLQYGIGRVASSFEPRDLAQALNGLTAEHLSSMKRASRETSKRINAKIEMEKLVKICDQLFSS